MGIDLQDLPQVLARQALEATMGQQLSQVWEQQARFNEMVQAVQTDIPDWGTTYILGIVGELAEVLSEMRWKRHRRYTGHVNRANITAELVDLTKYVFSLWQLYGVQPTEMLTQCWVKGQELEADLLRDFFPPTGRNVIISDLDGTVADFRMGFATWAQLDNDVKTLAVDLDNGLSFPTYEPMKDKFEAGGGYGDLPPYTDAVFMLRNEIAFGSWLLVATARPADRHQNIRQDTLHWLSTMHILPNAWLFGRDERILELARLGAGNRVVLLEDEPQLALRAAGAGFHVMLRDQPYNQGATHPLIHRFETFPSNIDWDGMFGEGSDV